MNAAAKAAAAQRRELLAGRAAHWRGLVFRREPPRRELLEGRVHLGARAPPRGPGTVAASPLMRTFALGGARAKEKQR